MRKIHEFMKNLKNEYGQHGINVLIEYCKNPEEFILVIKDGISNTELIALKESIVSLCGENAGALLLADKEKEMIILALKKHNNRRKDAAGELGISERTLYRKIREYSIDEYAL